MAISIWHVRHQGPVLAALGRTVWESLRPGRPTGGGPVATPGPELSEQVPPRPPALVRDAVRAMGGDPGTYYAFVPPWLFPQWTVPLLSRLLIGVPYDLARILNAGCAVTVNGPIPAGEPLVVRGRLESVDDDGRRVIFRQRVVTGPRSAPEAVVVEQTTILPPRPGARKAGGAERAKKDGPRVGADLRLLGRFQAGPRAGLEFALLTGDFNPIHWLPPYARLAGYRAPILHGYASLAHTWELLVRELWSGDTSRRAHVEVRFTKPLVLPADVGVFVGDDGTLALGDAPGAPAYLTGRIELQP
jgi:acyl dehydratase